MAGEVPSPLTLPGNLNSQGAPGKDDEVLKRTKGTVLRTPEVFFAHCQGIVARDAQRSPNAEIENDEMELRRLSR